MSVKIRTDDPFVDVVALGSNHLMRVTDDPYWGNRTLCKRLAERVGRDESLRDCLSCRAQAIILRGRG